jgi:hypothetical protein
MTDVDDRLAGQSGGTDKSSELPPGAGGDGESADEEQPATLAQVRSLIEQSQKDTLSASQSLVDKADGRTQKRIASAMNDVAKTISALQATGVEVSPEQETALRNNKVMEILTEGGASEGGDPDGSEQPAPDGKDGQALDPNDPAQATLALAYQKMQRAGVLLGDGDPEISIIDQETNDPAVFLASVDEAIKAKARRIAGIEDEGPTPDGAIRPAPGSEGAEDAGPGPNPRGKGSKPAAIPAGNSAFDNLKLGYEQASQGKKQ